jgi:hypothetical protein
MEESSFSPFVYYSRQDLFNDETEEKNSSQDEKIQGIIYSQIDYQNVEGRSDVIESSGPHKRKRTYKDISEGQISIDLTEKRKKDTKKKQDKVRREHLAKDWQTMQTQISMLGRLSDKCSELVLETNPLSLFNAPSSIQREQKNEKTTVSKTMVKTLNRCYDVFSKIIDTVNSLREEKNTIDERIKELLKQEINKNQLLKQALEQKAKEKEILEQVLQQQIRENQILNLLFKQEEQKNQILTKHLGEWETVNVQGNRRNLK